MRAKARFKVVASALVAVSVVVACSKTASSGSDTAAAAGQSLGDSARMIASNLAKFDTLDFVA